MPAVDSVSSQYWKISSQRGVEDGYSPQLPEGWTLMLCHSHVPVHVRSQYQM